MAFFSPHCSLSPQAQGQNQAMPRCGVCPDRTSIILSGAQDWHWQEPIPGCVVENYQPKLRMASCTLKT